MDNQVLETYNAYVRLRLGTEGNFDGIGKEAQFAWMALYVFAKGIADAELKTSATQQNVLDAIQRIEVQYLYVSNFFDALARRG